MASTDDDYIDKSLTEISWIIPYLKGEKDPDKRAKIYDSYVIEGTNITGKYINILIKQENDWDD